MGDGRSGDGVWVLRCFNERECEEGCEVMGWFLEVGELKSKAEDIRCEA